MPTATDARRDATGSADGPVLVRLRSDVLDWVRSIPSAPTEIRIGVTVGDESLASHADDLRLRGYDLLGVVPGRRPGLHADLVVTATLREEHPRWFAALLLVAVRVFDLRFGPVHLALRDELRAHRATLSREREGQD